MKKTVTLLVLYITLVFICEFLCVTVFPLGILKKITFQMYRGTLAYAQSMAGSNIIDHNCTDLSNIPVEWIRAAKANLHVGYNHASHGRQPIEGMRELDSFMGGTGLYVLSTDGVDRGPDVLDLTDGYDHPGTWWYPDSTFTDRLTDSDDWVMLTRTFLDDPKHAHINVVMWSWCNITHYPNGTGESAVTYDVERHYIPYMETLISEYGPEGSKIVSGERTTPVTFVFMTGHSNWGGDERNRGTFSANKKIRQHCIANNRVLYDFYDIECYDPEGGYFGDGEPNKLDYGNYQEGCGNGIHNLNADTSYAEDPCIIWENRRSWGAEWQNRHTEGEDYYVCDCPHCDEAPILANLKAYAMWWLMAVVAGWNRVPLTTTTAISSTITTSLNPSNPSTITTTISPPFNPPTSITSTTSALDVAECFLTIVPETAEMKPKESLKFDTTLSGSCSSPDYEWSVESKVGSTIDQNGHYIVGNNIDGFTEIIDLITVVDTENFSISAVATVTVSRCPLVLIYANNPRKIQLLKQFRDKVLTKTFTGQELINLYYLWSPLIINVIESDQEFREEMKEMIDELLPMIEDTLEW